MNAFREELLEAVTFFLRVPLKLAALRRVSSTGFCSNSCFLGRPSLLSFSSFGCSVLTTLLCVSFYNNAISLRAFSI